MRTDDPGKTWLYTNAALTDLKHHFDIDETAVIVSETIKYTRQENTK